MTPAAHQLARLVARQLADPEYVDLLADAVVDRVVDRLGDLHPEDDHGHPEFVDAAEIARRFNLTRASIYRMADQLGAVRLGDGDRPRLRFDPELVAERLDSRNGDPRPASSPRRTASRSRPPHRVELLPVRGQT